MGALLDGGAIYPHYATQPDRIFGLSPHADERLAAIVMLVEQVATLGTCGFILLARYLREVPAQAAVLRLR